MWIFVRLPISRSAPDWPSHPQQRHELRHVRQQVHLHLPQADVRGVRQRVLHHVSAQRETRVEQVEDVCQVWRAQQETSPQGRTHEAQGERPPTLSNEKKDQHQILRR